MKKSSLVAAALLAAACSPKIAFEDIAIVPAPVSITAAEGYAKVDGSISAPEGELSEVAATFVADASKDGTLDYALACGQDASIVLALDETLAPEEYTVAVAEKVTVTGGSPAGVWWGLQTVRQIAVQAGKWFPCLTVEDAPAFAYRALHLDCCRHFFDVEQVKRFVDVLSVGKFNTFHWHLTEDQGWRAEIRKYPALTEVGAVRAQTLVGHHGSTEYDGIEYGGFYTQDQMREVVEYAAARGITVIPEVEMPGHALAALAAYPELGCTGGPYAVEGNWGVFPDIFCVGKDATMQFLKDVLDEICEIFPSEYIHIGGDEAPRDRWIECPDCQKRIKDEGLASEAELQSWLVREIESYLASKGRRIIGWDEILEGGVTPSATVMSWRGAEGGKAAAAQGNDAIMCPGGYCYLDWYQTADPEANGEPLSIGGHDNLEMTYSFNPFEGLDEASAAHILGCQGNNWSEYTPDMDQLLFKAYPRATAIAEIDWNPAGKTAYPEFVERVRKAVLPLFEANGWNYADYAFRNPAVE